MHERPHPGHPVLALALAAAGALLPARPAGAQQSATVVYPTGAFPADVDNVQAALDAGGTIVLMSRRSDGTPTAFNFGHAHPLQGGGVQFRVDAQLVGETAAGATTTIRGGYLPIRAFTPGLRLRIQGIHFDAPANSAIVITRSIESDVVGNRISDVVPTNVGGFGEARGIKVLGNSDPLGAVTGPVRIVGNVIENLHAVASQAVILDSINAEVEIRENQVRSVHAAAIGAVHCRGSIVIADNLLEPGGAPQSSGHGIAVLNNSGAAVSIQRNRVECEAPHAMAIRLIRMGTTGPLTIESNDLEVTDSSAGALTLIDTVWGARVSGNRIRGRGAYAIQLLHQDGGTAVGNLFVDNDLTGFEPAAAHVFLDVHTRDNSVLGSSGSVIDLGVDNQTPGLVAPE